MESADDYLLHDLPSDRQSTSKLRSYGNSNVIIDMRRSQFICLMLTFALVAVAAVVQLILLVGHYTSSSSSVGAPFTQLPRTGNEIMVCGQLYNIGTPVVLWTDPGGYDAYRTQLRFVPYNISDYKFWPNVSVDRFNLRDPNFPDSIIEEVRGGGWPLSLLQTVVDQFVIHFDQIGYSKETFNVLQDIRGLSIHFMLDVDGTLYQTLDLKEMARHATISNTRSIGIEVANIGAYQPGVWNWSQWYTTNDEGQTIMELPPDNWVRTPNFVGSPARPNLIPGNIQAQNLLQYDYTPQQYAALTKLLAMICKLFPLINVDYPRDSHGLLIPHVLTPQQWLDYQGIMGHYHVQLDKIDPGPALQWDYLISEIQNIMASFP